MGKQLEIGFSSIGALKIDSKKGNHGMINAAPIAAGYDAVIREVQKSQTVDVIGPENAANYETLLLSILSPVEIEKLLDWSREYRKPPGQKIIAGGMCALNPWPLYGLIDCMVFGRAEGLMDTVLSGKPHPSVWRKTDDPGVEGEYTIRQAETMLDGERAIGCPNKCAYCQYTWIRKFRGADGYDPGMVRPEDDWKRLEIKESGRYVSAIDGLSEETRYRVNKHLSDEDIIAKIGSIQKAGFPSATVIKCFMIVGFPWETPETVERDIGRLRELMIRADTGAGGKVVMMLLFTPFSPEPMTPMEGCAIDAIDWRPVLERAGRCIYWSDTLDVFILPQINSADTLARRIEINRCGRDHVGLSERLRYPRKRWGEWDGYAHLQSYAPIRAMSA